MKVLFITRKFPPSVGGMEQFAFKLAEAYRQLFPESQVWSFGGQRWHAVWWLPWVAIRLFISRQADVVHLMDGVMVLLAPVARLYGRTVVVTIHGLEATYPKVVYQRLFLMGIRQVHGVVSVSRSTFQLVEHIGRAQHVALGNAGIPHTLITHGVSQPAVNRQQAQAELEQRFSIDADTRVVLLAGRFIARKGQSWFLHQVAPQLLADPKIAVVLVGDGPERSVVAEAVEKLESQGFVDRVLLRGQVSHQELAYWYARAEVCVMPNRQVTGDVEGFGMVAVEAQSYGCPVVASQLEGITDAVPDSQHGQLVPANDPAAFVTAIQTLSHWGVEQRQHLAHLVGTQQTWDNVAMNYAGFFETCQKHLHSLP